MRLAIVRLVMVAMFFLSATAGQAMAEPLFLAKQYTRCSTCHYSPTGGGLLTPYGRSLSHAELSMLVQKTSPDAQGTGGTRGEEAFLWGALGDKLGPLKLGIELRPSHLQLSVFGTSSSRNLFMNADLVAAYRVRDWTAYGEMGRQPRVAGSAAKVDSYEYLGGEAAGAGCRVPRRPLPAGLRHSLRRSHFVQSESAWLRAVRSDLRSRSVADDRPLSDAGLRQSGARRVDHSRRWAPGVYGVGAPAVRCESACGARGVGIYRDASRLETSNGSGGVAFGLSPTSRITIWNQLDALFRDEAPGGTSYVFVNETAFEAIRGVWLKLSPQVHSGGGVTSPGLTRILLGADLLPRTHWNVNLSYYRDRNRQSDIVSKIFLIQLHLYI